MDGLQLTAYALPGHTPDSGAFLAGGVLYLGDSAVATKDGTVRATQWIFSGAERKPDGEKRILSALHRLDARLRADGASVARLAFAHSDPLDDGSALGKAQ